MLEGRLFFLIFHFSLMYMPALSLRQLRKGNVWKLTPNEGKTRSWGNEWSRCGKSCSPPHEGGKGTAFGPCVRRSLCYSFLCPYLIWNTCRRSVIPTVGKNRSPEIQGMRSRSQSWWWSWGQNAGVSSCVSTLSASG